MNEEEQETQEEQIFLSKLLHLVEEKKRFEAVSLIESNFHMTPRSKLSPKFNAGCLFNALVGKITDICICDTPADGVELLAIINGEHSICDTVPTFAFEALMNGYYEFDDCRFLIYQEFDDGEPGSFFLEGYRKGETITVWLGDHRTTAKANWNHQGDCILANVIEDLEA